MKSESKGTDSDISPESVAPTSQKIDASKSKDAHSEKANKDTALAVYSRNLGSLLKADDAEAIFKSELRAAGLEIDKKGFSALVPAYVRYEHAMSHTVEKLKNLTPPKSAIAVQGALVQTLIKLDENLLASISAMKADNGETAGQLAVERRQLKVEGGQSLQIALDHGHFDVSAFAKNSSLIRKSR